MKRNHNQLKQNTELNPTHQMMSQLSFDGLFESSDDKIKNHVYRKETFNSETDTEKEFTLLVHDFDGFVDYLENHTVQLTKTMEYISRKHLLDINNRLTVRNETATGYTEQEYYPYIHFFYYLSLSGGLVKKESGKGGKLFLYPTEKLHLYKELTDEGKYFFLLETFWVDMNWATLLNKSHNTLLAPLQELLYIFSQESVELNERVLSKNLDKWNHFLLYFEWFGFWECEINQERIDTNYRKNQYFAKSIKLTDFALKLIPILLVERNFQVWNISERKQSGEINPIPGDKLEDRMFGEISQEVEDAIIKRMEQDQSSQPFLEPFKSLFPDESILKYLPRENSKFINGVYSFKVSLKNGVWREVVLSSNHTMEHLHDIILEAFTFDDDHLYSFFMDGKKWSNDCITSPNDNYGHPQANKVHIGDLVLECGKRFLYLYDYGDEWMFTVEVIHIQKTDPEPFKPFVKVSIGEAPTQYDAVDW